MERMNGEYRVHSDYFCIPSFQVPEDLNEWDKCPYCGLTPKVWEFNNGRWTACGCWNNEYVHFSVRAESVMSRMERRDTSILNHGHELRDNWNHWCRTGEMIFPVEPDDGRW